MLGGASCVAGFGTEDRGSILVETALSVAAIVMVALPFANLIGFATQSSRDLAEAHAAVRQAVQAREVTSVGSSLGVEFNCGSAPQSIVQSCALRLPRGEYVMATKDTVVRFPFGLELHTNARAISRV